MWIGEKMVLLTPTSDDFFRYAQYLYGIIKNKCYVSAPPFPGVPRVMGQLFPAWQIELSLYEQAMLCDFVGLMYA